MNDKVLVIVADDTPLGTLLATAKATNSTVSAFVAGSREQAELIAAAGVDSVTLFSAGKGVPAEALAPAIADAATQMQPRLVLGTNTAATRVILGSTAAQLGGAITSSVISASFEDDKTVVDRSVAERRAVETVEATTPVVAFVLEGADDMPQSEGVAPIEEVILQTQASIEIAATHEEAGGSSNLAASERVVGAGRGIVSKEELALVEELAQALNAETACSLPLCDDYRWFEHARVVGSSTQRISPRLYVSVGVSGQPQHMTGVRGAKMIVAINNDPEAPIFRSCSYGIVGDLNKVAPALTAALAAS